MLASQGWHDEAVIKRMKKQRAQPLKELNPDDSFSCKKEEATKKQRKKKRDGAYRSAYSYHGCDSNQTALANYLEAIDYEFGASSSDSDS